MYFSIFSELTLSRYTSVLIISTYLYGCLWAFPPIIGWGDYGIEPHGTSCTLKWTGNRSFVTLMLVTCIALPVLIMNICYGLVWDYLKKNTKSLKKWSTGKLNWKKRECYLIKVRLRSFCKSRHSCDQREFAFFFLLETMIIKYASNDVTKYLIFTVTNNVSFLTELLGPLFRVFPSFSIDKQFW